MNELIKNTKKKTKKNPKEIGKIRSMSISAT